MRQVKELFENYGLRFQERENRGIQLNRFVDWSELNFLLSNSLLSPEEKKQILKERVVWGFLKEAPHLEVKDVEKFVSSFGLSEMLLKVPEKIRESYAISPKKEFGEWQMYVGLHLLTIRKIQSFYEPEQAKVFIKQLVPEYQLKKIGGIEQAEQQANMKLRRIVFDITDEVTQMSCEGFFEQVLRALLIHNRNTMEAAIQELF